MVCFSPMGYGVLNRKVLRDKSNFFALLLKPFAFTCLALKKFAVQPVHTTQTKKPLASSPSLFCDSLPL